MYYIAKILNKDLYLNQISYGLSGHETTYHMICKTPLLFSERNDLKELLDYYKAGFGKIINDIDDSTINDIIIKKVELIIK